MQKCRLDAWIAWVSIGLALVLSSCVAQDVQTKPPPTLAPPTAAPAVTSSFIFLTEEYLAWAVRQSDEALHRDLQAILERWKGLGRLQALFDKWLRFRVG